MGPSPYPRGFGSIDPEAMTPGFYDPPHLCERARHSASQETRGRRTGVRGRRHANTQSRALTRHAPHHRFSLELNARGRVAGFGIWLRSLNTPVYACWLQLAPGHRRLRIWKGVWDWSCGRTFVAAPCHIWREVFESEKCDVLQEPARSM
jgi:hypothetical protein